MTAGRCNLRSPCHRPTAGGVNGTRQSVAAAVSLRQPASIDGQSPHGTPYSGPWLHGAQRNRAARRRSAFPVCLTCCRLLYPTLHVTLAVVSHTTRPSRCCISHYTLHLLLYLTLHATLAAVSHTTRYTCCCISHYTLHLLLYLTLHATLAAVSHTTRLHLLLYLTLHATLAAVSHTTRYTCCCISHYTLHLLLYLTLHAPVAAVSHTTRPSRCCISHYTPQSLLYLTLHTRSSCSVPRSAAH